MIKKSKKYVPVLISKREYDLYKKIVDNHNEKQIKYTDFEYVEKLSLSKLFSHAIRQYVNRITSDVGNWFKDSGEVNGKF